MKDKFKETMLKLLTRKPHYGTRQAITMPFTAPSDGVLMITLASNGLGVFYVSGEGDSRFLTYVGNTQQGSTTITAPIHKGQTYTVVYSSAVATANYFFVPLEWGGYCVSQLLQCFQPFPRLEVA